MPSNPYEPNRIAQNGAEKIASIRFPEIVRASIAQLGALNIFVMLTMGLNAQWQLLEEFEIELGPFSVVTLRAIRYWPFIGTVLGIAAIGSLIYYQQLNGRPVRLAKRWWYFSIYFWVTMISVLLAGAVPPIYSLITGLTGD
jgi:hypothetical protein